MIKRLIISLLFIPTVILCGLFDFVLWIITGKIVPTEKSLLYKLLDL